MKDNKVYLEDKKIIIEVPNKMEKKKIEEVLEDLINNFQHNNIKDVDMVLADSTVLEELKSLNALTSNISEEEDIVKERFKDNNNSWIGVWYDPIVFCYNLDYVKNNYDIACMVDKLLLLYK